MLSAHFTPLETLQVELPFRPTWKQKLLVRVLSPLGRHLPIPREQETLRLAEALLGETPSPDLGRRLFRNAIKEAALLVTGGWNQLDLSPLDILSGIWKETGRPTLFLSMHHGNWEWLAGILYHLRKDSIGVARAAHQRPGQILLEHVRRYHKTPVLYNQTGTRVAHRTLRQGGLVAFLADQRPPTQGEPGVWFGSSTLVTPLPRLWCRGITPDIWTGWLLPGPSSYQLTLKRYSPTVISQWDELLDRDLLPVVRQTPDWHFGLMHRRLVSRGTSG